MKTISASARPWRRRPMERPFSQTLSFDHLEVLVLVENGGAGIARRLRGDEPFTTAAFAASPGVATPNTKA
jgi:hypothetical protein